jgi:hypothetical protein
MGNGQWVMGTLALGIKKTQERNARSNRILSMPTWTMPDAHCPIP